MPDPSQPVMAMVICSCLPSVRGRNMNSSMAPTRFFILYPKDTDTINCDHIFVQRALSMCSAPGQMCCVCEPFKTGTTNCPDQRTLGHYPRPPEPQTRESLNIAVPHVSCWDLNCHRDDVDCDSWQCSTCQNVTGSMGAGEYRELRQGHEEASCLQGTVPGYFRGDGDRFGRTG